MAKDENKEEKEDEKNNAKEDEKNNAKEDEKNNENKIPEPSKLKTNYGWECYKDTGNC